MSLRVAVVGAGAAGLCAVRLLASRADTFLVTAFEQTDRLGGTWVYTDRIGSDSHGLPIHSSMYRNLRTNLPKEVMAFPDFEFDQNLPSFVKHEDVLHYLEQYAAHFSLHQYIKYRTQVVQVKPKPCSLQESRSGYPHQWEVTTKSTTGEEQPLTQCFDAVIVCNGHYSVPLIPDINGLETFSGQIMHSHNYREPEHFHNKRVICLGASSSGQDICLDLSAHAQMVFLCHNKALLKCPLPCNVQQKPGIQSVNGSVFTLHDGSQITADCLLFCTGYHFVFPFLSKDCHLHVQEERITPLYKHLFHTEFPTLSFVGICKTICPFPQFHLQVQLVLSVLEGSQKLPSKADMDNDIERDFHQRLSEGLPQRHAHTMGGRQWDYNRHLATMAQCQPLPQAVEDLYTLVHNMRALDLMGYKAANFHMVGEQYRSITHP